MRAKKPSSGRGGALKCEVRKIEPRKLMTKKCFVNLKKLDEKLHLNVKDKVPVLVKSENQDQSSSCDRHGILKPFKTVLRLGDMSFTSDDPFLKLAEQENTPKPLQRTTRSYRKKNCDDIYEFTSQSEEDCDPTADVVKKMIKEGRATLVKRKPKTQVVNCKTKDKSISECVRKVERYCRRSHKKILRERKPNCRGAWNQQSEDSKYDRNLNLDEFHESRNSAVVDFNDNVQNHTEEVDSCKNTKTENIKILEVLILPNKAIVNPTPTFEDKKPDEVINSNAAVEYSKEICDTADTPGDGESGSEILNQDDYLLNEEADYLNLSRISEPSSTQMDSCFVDVNSTAKTPDPEIINTSICHDKTSTQMDAGSTEQAHLEIHEPRPSFAQTDSSIETKTIAKTPEPKPIRKAFWEIEEPEETLDKSLIKKTYSRHKPKEPRTHFFIKFSDDEDSKKVNKSTKEISSKYYTRSKIQNWIESTRFETKSENKLDAKQTNKVKKAILKPQNKISDNHANLKTQQKQNSEKNKINNKIKADKCISSSSKKRGRGFRQLYPIRL